MRERERKVSEKEGAKEMNWEKGKGEEGKQKGMSKGNGLGKRERKVTKKEGAKEMDWEKGDQKGRN